MVTDSHPSDKSKNIRWTGTVLVSEGTGEQEIPRCVEIEPPLCVEPTGGHSRHMQQGMPIHAHEFGSVPGEEGSRGLANLCRMFDKPEAYRAPLPLIAQNPAQAEQGEAKGGDQLDVSRRVGIWGGEGVGDIERSEVDNGEQKSDFGAQETPAAESSRPRGSLRADGQFSQRNGGNGG